MSDFRASPLARARAALVSVAMALLTLAVATGLAWPQPAKQPSVSSQADATQAPASQASPDQAAPQPGQPGSPAAPRAENPGLFNEIGKLFDNPSSVFPALPTLKSPQDAIDDFNAGAKDTTDGLSQLTTPLIVRGRMVCPVAANGASDCKAASDKLCQTKGFKEGKSLDTDSAQSCSAAALLSGGNRVPGNCRTNNYVTRALCQ
jgi:hypothetical protein